MLPVFGGISGSYKMTSNIGWRLAREGEVMATIKPHGPSPGKTGPRPVNRRYPLDLPLTLIMLIPENFPALNIFPMLNTSLLAPVHVAVRSGPRFRAVHAGLAAFKL